MVGLSHWPLYFSQKDIVGLNEVHQEMMIRRENLLKESLIVSCGFVYRQMAIRESQSSWSWLFFKGKINEHDDNPMSLWDDFQTDFMMVCPL